MNGNELRAWSIRIAAVAGAAALLGLVPRGVPDGVADAGLARPRPAQVPEVVANDNGTPGGRLRDGVLSVDLVAARGIWFPEEAEGPGHEVHVFGEEGRPLSNPGPLLRVPVGTEIRATVRNGIAGSPLAVHGLHDRPGAPGPLIVPAGGTRAVRFRVTSPGTYFYWATTRGARTLRDRFGPDSQLIGALIVDPAGPVPADRVFIIGIEADSAAVPAERELYAAVVNGLSWPHSLKATVQVDDTVRMRWINASDRFHPMHLHGFYFSVDRHGDIARDTAYEDAAKRMVVTELMASGQTMSLTWVPSRPGNWLMHCHMAVHMSPDLRRGARLEAAHVRAANHTLDVMAGLVTGWRVLPSGRVMAPRAAESPAPEPRHLRLVARPAPGRFGADPGLGFVLQGDDVRPGPDSVVIPGPPIVLTRGRPVGISVVNELAEATSIHWHGIELDSWFDGVSGWSGSGDVVAPAVAPRDSFQVRFTPPRAGTFIYHSHFHEQRQLASGMYGPLIVLEPGSAYDPDTDRTWVLSQSGPAEGVRLMLNGSLAPVIDMRAGRRHRIRLINIHPNVPVTVSLLADPVPVTWRALAKDGADLPPAQARTQPAQVRIGVGETYDFELTPERPGELRLRASDQAGVVLLSGTARVR